MNNTNWIEVAFRDYKKAWDERDALVTYGRVYGMHDSMADAYKDRKESLDKRVAESLEKLVLTIKKEGTK